MRVNLEFSVRCRHVGLQLADNITTVIRSRLLFCCRPIVWWFFCSGDVLAINGAISVAAQTGALELEAASSESLM